MPVPSRILLVYDYPASQAALARHLKVPRQHVSEARTGGRTIPTDRLPALGQLVHMTPAELWTLQEVANMPRRNPFARDGNAP